MRIPTLVAMAKNSVLVRDAEPAMAVARGQSEASGQTEHVYTDVQYAAGTWAQARRVVIKAEVVQLAGRAPQDNPRFVVTNLRQTPRFIYERISMCRKRPFATGGQRRRPAPQNLTAIATDTSKSP